VTLRQQGLLLRSSVWGLALSRVGPMSQGRPKPEDLKWPHCVPMLREQSGRGMGRGRGGGGFGRGEGDVWSLLENEEDAEVEAELLREAEMKIGYARGTSALSVQAGTRLTELQGVAAHYSDAEEGSIEEEWEAREEEEEEGEEGDGGFEIDSGWSETEDLTVDIVLASDADVHIPVHPPAAGGAPALEDPAAAATLAQAPAPSLRAAAAEAPASAPAAAQATAMSIEVADFSKEEGSQRRTKGGGK